MPAGGTGLVLRGLRKEPAAIGKWHLGWDWTHKEGKAKTVDNIGFTKRMANGPTDRGFDYFYGLTSPSGPPYLYMVNDMAEKQPNTRFEESGGGLYKIKGGIGHSDWSADGMQPHLADKMLEYLDENKDSDKPFFLYMALTAPHIPLFPSKEFKGKSKIGDYGDLVMMIDDIVGRVNRKLKEIGVGIYFEKENINTLSEKSELFITILASVAQGESENISSNNRWAIQKRFQDGTYIISTPAYGYGKDEDGNLVIIESEAETVRWIYESYLNGMGVYVIAKALNQKGIPTIRGAEKWQDGVIQDILKNPIYEGDMLQQRTYTETRFPFVRRVNNGQRNQYLIKDSHPPIVTHEEAEAVRNLMAYRVDVLHMNKSDYTKRYLFSGRIICGECGRTFRRQKIYIGKPYEKIIWTCSGHVEDKESCCLKAIREDVLHRAFTDMWNKLYTNQGTILEPLLKELTELVAARQDSEEIRQLDKEIKDISEQSQILNQVMRKGYMDSALFYEKNNYIGLRLLDCKRIKALLHSKRPGIKEIASTERLIRLLQDEGGAAGRVPG